MLDRQGVWIFSSSNGLYIYIFLSRVKHAVAGACRPHIRQLLLAHGVIVESEIDDAHEDAHTAHPGCRAFDHMEAGLQYCEERFLEVELSPAMPCHAMLA